MPKIIKTLVQIRENLYLCTHRQLIIEHRLGLMINAALAALNAARKQAGPQIKEFPSITNGIRRLAELRGRLKILVDKQIRIIDREKNEGRIFVGVKKINRWSAFNEMIGLLRPEGRGAPKLKKLVTHIRDLTSASIGKSTAGKDSRLKADISAFEKIAIKDEVNIMEILFLDHVTMIGYTQGDRNKVVALIKKLEGEKFPAIFVQKFLEEISKEEAEEKRLLGELETEARLVESKFAHAIV